MSQHVETGVALGAIVVGLLVGLYRAGWLRPERIAANGGGNNSLNGDVKDIKETLDEVQATTERALDVALGTQADVNRVEDKVDAVGETVFRLHEDDPSVTDPNALRDSLDVENLADDFKRGGWDSDPDET